ncbi:helix-turn-helix domain-containing protein [Rosenbergiella collisarenosi]|uniref:helix-turn-helix domain-containing protein n=1 Tax=Rosenbergiella collisarenosi TaxID=1544695 RepID=UPI001F4F76A0|nr:helix-turn-helix domain-containing protein [Rosenbergiella collisarenosi]
MPSVPFPIITLLVFISLLVVMVISKGIPRRGAYITFIMACITLLTLSTSRWESGSLLLGHLQSWLALFLPVVIYRCFSSPSWPVLYLPTAGAGALKLCCPWLTDPLLILLSLGYGYRLLDTAITLSPQTFASKWQELLQPRNMLLLASSYLCVSAGTDLLIALDFAFLTGKEAPILIVLGQLIWLAMVFYGGVKIAYKPASPFTQGSDIPRPPLCTDASNANADRYKIIAARVKDSAFYLNPDLTLALLARKLGMPARHISEAVNTATNSNFSQWINGFRIEKAQQLLTETSLTITEIMLESGFSTKSNFNREFQRITGMSPTMFRGQRKGNLAQCSKIG